MRKLRLGAASAPLSKVHPNCALITSGPYADLAEADGILAAIIGRPRSSTGAC